MDIYKLINIFVQTRHIHFTCKLDYGYVIKVVQSNGVVNVTTFMHPSCANVYVHIHTRVQPNSNHMEAFL